MVMSTAAPMALTRMLHLARRLLALLMLRMLTLILKNYKTITLPFEPFLMLSSEVAVPTDIGRPRTCFSGRQRGPETLPLSPSDLAISQADVPYQELEEADGDSPANLLLRDGCYLSRC